jgi:TRAP-type C4-dicarboxylate transport system permease large subunit
MQTKTQVPDPLARLAKEWLYIKSIFLQLLLSLFFFISGMMADCMADLLRTKAVLIPTNSFPD